MANTRYNAVEIALAAAAGLFETGKTVTIELFDAATGTSEPLDSNACIEIGVTGIFRWPFSNITTAPSSFKQFIYVMTDNSATPVKRREIVDVLGWVESVVTVIPADMCKVSTLIFRQDDKSGIAPNRLLSDVVEAYAEIQGTFFQTASGKHFDTARRKPYFDDAGEAYWLLPQGSSVKFFIKQLNISKIVTIPATSTADLNTLLTA